MNLFTRSVCLLFLLVSAVFGAQGQVAGFTASPTAGCAPLVVHFTNTSTGAASYAWNFGNTNTSVLTNPSTSYLSPGTYTCTLVAYNSGHTDSSVHTLTITVYPAPTVSFVANDTAVCPGSPVTFTSTGSAGVSGAVTYSWNFGDGGSSNSGTPSHSFTTSGYKNITLSVTNSEGCVASHTIGSYIDVYTPPVPSFSATPEYVCNPPANVTFANSSTGAGPLSYSWEFGDGGGSPSADPVHTYASTGYYNVTLVVTDGHGCKDTLTEPDFIEVGGVTPSFTAAATACVYSPVFFDNTSPPGVTSTWYFGTGATSVSPSPTYTYNTPGTYTVMLVVYNGHCYDTVTHPITISPQPTGSFSWSPLDPCPAPATISFTGTAPAGSTETWSFGDGGTGTGLSDTHTYGGDGVYTVDMIITDGSGCKDTIVQKDTIYNLIVGISHIIDSAGCVPLTVPFTSYELTTVPGGTSYPYPFPIASYTWNFGDGSPTSSSVSPSHTYTAAGSYTATLTIMTANGCTQTTTKSIVVGVPPVASFTAAPTTICTDRVVTFTNTSTGATSYTWYFGDGSSTSDPDPTHTYILPDTAYTVMLIAFDNGCPDTLIRHFYITVDSPKAIISDVHNCIPDNQVAFADSSLGDNTHEWFFGDGTTSTASNLTHTYPALGVYTVMLTTYNTTSGCRDTATATINLVKPIPNFTSDDTAVCKNGIVDFWPLVTGGVASVYYWYVDGSFINNDSLMIDTFTVTGQYNVELIIKDQNGCYDTMLKNNYLTVAKPVDSFTAVPPNGCWPLAVIFTDHSTDQPGVTFTNFSWTFGDGATSSVTTPVTEHTYTAGGTFAVQEIVTDNIGCKDTIIRPSLITVYKPDAVFMASYTHPCVGSPVTFNNLSTGIVSSFWMFGDGGTSSAASPTYAYSAPGVYTVKLVVTDVHGCTDTATYVDYITITRPVASFYMSDSFSLCPPLSVNFINTSTGASTYFWNFGDGSTSILISPSDLYTTIEYDTVMLVAYNSYGCPDTALGHVDIFGSVGGFSYTPLSGCAPLTVHFGATISNVPNIIWDFADGTTTAASFSDSATHVYTIPGAYVPKLILSDNTGCEKSNLGADTIKVDGVIAGFNTQPGLCINVPFTFTDTSSSYFSTITSWHWTLAPGDTSDVSAPSYTYSATGSYPIDLVVTDAWGCMDSVIENATVFPPPVITVSPDTVVCLTDPASLTGYGGVSYTWAPAATVSCTLCTTTQATPSVVTQYTVTGTDAHGCQNTDTVTVLLRKYTVSNGWGDTAVCYGVPVPISDTGGTKYTWIPSSGLSSVNASTVVATPDVTTTYTVTAQLADCIPDTNYITVTVYPLPTVKASGGQSVVAGSEAQLSATGTNISTYSWSPEATLSCSTCANPVCLASVTTTYNVDVASIHDCRSSDTVTVKVFCESSQVFIPNSFTPNGDGENDVFYPRGSGISLIKSFRIYNRWGEMLFERSNISINDAANAWDGSYNGGSPRPDVYVYIIDAVCETGQPINLKGDVTIIR